MRYVEPMHAHRYHRRYPGPLQILCLGIMLLASFTNPLQSQDTPRRFAIAIHGGAGINPDKLSEEARKSIESSLTETLRYGVEQLKAGATALDVVEGVIRRLEDDPLFNAGRGAVFNHAGGHELDASIMDGRDKSCGAVAGVRIVKNPISLARLVKEKTPHVLLAGDGAEDFAMESKDDPRITIVENRYFSTEERRIEWERKRSRNAVEEGKRGTVGCVILDSHGDLAAGTSTGGLTNKRFGRVGDSPIIGAGTYADNATCAVSCTGTGEFFIRHAVAFHVHALMAYQSLSLRDATDQVMFKILPDDIGGLIAVDRQGNIAMPTNTAGMSRGAADSTGRFEVALARGN